MQTVDISWAAIVVCGVVNMVLGMIWYAPQVFGGVWMEELGKKKGDMKMDPVSLVSMFIIAMAIAYVLRHFIVYAGADTTTLGVETGIWASIGLFALPTASGVFAGGTSWRMWAVNAGYWVVAVAIMGAILATMH